MAMGLLKSAVKNTGEHKQKILVKISMSGITLLDQVNQVGCKPTTGFAVSMILFTLLT